MDVAQRPDVLTLFDAVAKTRPCFDTVGGARLVAQTEWG